MISTCNKRNIQSRDQTELDVIFTVRKSWQKIQFQPLYEGKKHFRIFSSGEIVLSLTSLMTFYWSFILSQKLSSKTVDILSLPC